MVNFTDWSAGLSNLLCNFPWPTWIAAASNVVMMLGVEHWFPWSFHLGHKLSRYHAFASGCIAIVLSFGLWAIMEGLLTAWLIFTITILLLHWPGWRLKAIHRINYILAYVLTTLPALAVFGGWAIWAGEIVALVGLCGLYVVGGIATKVFNILDKVGVNENFERINHLDNKH